MKLPTLRRYPVGRREIRRTWMDKSKSTRRTPGSLEQFGAQIDATGLMRLGATNLVNHNYPNRGHQNENPQAI